MKIKLKILSDQVYGPSEENLEIGFRFNEWIIRPHYDITCRYDSK